MSSPKLRFSAANAGKFTVASFRLGLEQDFHQTTLHMVCHAIEPLWLIQRNQGDSRIVERDCKAAKMTELHRFPFPHSPKRLVSWYSRSPIHGPEPRTGSGMRLDSITPDVPYQYLEGTHDRARNAS